MAKIKKNANWQTLDPFFEREVKKYGKNPLPSREYLLQWLEKQGKLLTVLEMIEAFQLSGERAEFFTHRIKAMISSGQLMRNRQGKIGLPKKMDLVKGTVIAHAEGYGFLNVDNEEQDGFIPPKYMNELMHGDKILARVSNIDRQGRKDFAPVEILERAQKRVVGKLTNVQGVWFVSPENRRLTQQLLIPANMLGGGQKNQIVIAEITEYPTRYQQPIGKIVAVLGEQMAAGLEVEIALANHNIPHEFPDAVRQEAEKLPDILLQKDYQGRLDLRHLPLVTIDGISSRDFDDAVFAEKRGENYRLYVAIADVSHYVTVGSPLDKEAYLRGTSVYFPDRVIPMLPEKLSNGLCSLNPNVDRLCMVCELTIAPDGSVKRTKFHEAVMHSHARLTYETAEKILFERDPLVRESFAQLVKPLEDLKSVYEILRRARQARHTIEFNFQEAEFFYDGEGKIESISARERLDSHKLIEECMIIANVAAAKFLQRHKIPALYRVHDNPSHERLEKLKAFTAKLGLKWQGKEDEITPEQLMALLDKAREREDHLLIEKMILRSMAQAVYTPENRGHFGLALENYAHFTSPIRRYPDLLVHRAIRHILRGGNAKDYIYRLEAMTEMGKQCSMAERRADEATREAMDFLKCEFMSHHLGEEFVGQISNVTSFGFFVTLEDYFIDGLVHVSTLTSDYYHFDADTLSLSGERMGQRFAMMDTVRIRVAKADTDTRKIDFEWLETLSGSPSIVNRKSAKKKRAAKVKPAIQKKAAEKAPKAKKKTAKRKAARRQKK
ncbi:ribonuclease R [Suttonella ornithocola]|uniref:Ribonuclease R n=1 Tax=Suttonella ornithocola TaxID=279832 RepID=A0A380MM37_9GAMM|nr:ribonuclease R [Suttonella ornithocola]SUO93372.1 Ribonuclease R [Suttonella ornithocola]